MSGSLRPISVASTGLVAAGAALVAVLAWWSLPWPLIHDVALMHYVAWRIAGGAWQAGQRDFLLCAFLLLGALGVVRGLERGRWASLVWSGAALGAGITLKPHAALFTGALAAVVALTVARACGASTACRAT